MNKQHKNSNNTDDGDKKEKTRREELMEEFDLTEEDFESPIPDDWPVPECIRASRPLSKYAKFACYGTEIENRTLWTSQGEVLSDEIVDSIKSVECGMEGAYELDGERIHVNIVGYQLQEVKDDGTEVWKMSEGPRGFSLSQIYEIKDDEKIDQRNGPTTIA